MKRFALLCCLVVPMIFNACEKHDVSELKKIDPEHSAEHEAAPAKEAAKK